MTEARPETYQVEDGWIELMDGTAFYFADPKPEMFKVQTIATVLGRICRFNGHTVRHYSVAEHCCLLADYVAKQSWSSPRDALTALHHDDAEFIIGDLARPIKAKLPQFKALEDVIDRAVAKRFGTIWPLPDWLKGYDARILKDERLSVMNTSHNDWGIDELEKLGVTFYDNDGIYPMRMTYQFLKRHHRLTALRLKYGDAAMSMTPLPRI